MAAATQIEPGPIFSQKGSGVTISTSHGQLNFNADEYTYYHNMFLILDVHKQGIVRTDSSQFVLLLLRISLSWRSVDAALHLVAEGDISQEPSPVGSVISLRSKTWLMLCQLLAHCVISGRDPKEKLFKDMHAPNFFSPPCLDFHLGELRNRFVESGRAYLQFSTSVPDWKVYGDDFQTQHVKFRVVSLRKLVNQTSVPINAIEEQISVERRYSEFEHFVQIIQRNFRGFLCPPLPAKNFRFIAQQDTTVQQRAMELQLFLDFMCNHPQLRYCVELAVFLEASSAGLKSLFDVHSHIVRGHLALPLSQGPRNSGSQLDGVMKLLTNSAQAVSSGAQVVVGPNNKAVEFLSSLWGSVKKNVTMLTAAPPVHVCSPRDRQIMEKTMKLLEKIHRAANALETTHSLCVQRSQEINFLALAFRSLAEIESVPRLVNTLQCTSTELSSLSHSQQERLERVHATVVVPVSFVGRFGERYKVVTLQHEETLDALNDAHDREQHARRRVEAYPHQPASTAVDAELHKAEFELCEAETVSEAAKQEEELVLRRLRKESRQIELVSRHQLIAYFVRFVDDQRRAAQEARLRYEKLYDLIESMGT